MITRRTVLCLGLAQLISWGVTYYLIGGFGERIAADLGWSRALVHGGFSAALLVMAASSPVVGRLIDRRGGRAVMAAGSVLAALGCAGLAAAHAAPAYYAAWICLGLAMRCTLYDAAFAALARIGGPGAQPAMSQITLLGGLASTVFWPVGDTLATHLGWRGALLAYAVLALVTVPLHLAIPGARRDGPGAAAVLPVPHQPLAGDRRDRVIAGSLYATIATLTNGLNAGMSAHMIGLMTGLGLVASVAVWVAALRGIGQSAARLGAVLLDRRLHPLALNLVAGLLLSSGFLAGLFSGGSLPAALAFPFLYGAGNGVATITRGTLPLVLFDHRSYGAFVGGLLVPSFALSAAAPVAYAWVIERFGAGGALHLSLMLAAATLAASLVLQQRFRRLPAGRSGGGEAG